MAAASVCVPRVSPNCLLLLQETLQDQQVGLTQVSFKLLLLPWVLEHVKLCVHPLRVESLLPPTLWVSAGLQSQTFWGVVFPVQDPQDDELDVGLRFLTPCEEPLQLSFFSQGYRS